MQNKSELTKEEKPIDTPNYTQEEEQYLGNLRSRLFKAKISRDRVHAEFNNKTFFKNYLDNEALANTFIDSLEDKSVQKKVRTGTVEQKLLAILAEINRLNLSAQTRAFDNEDNEFVELGAAITDMVDKCKELDGDDEHKLLRQMEMLKQGHVFMMANWSKEWKTSKKLLKPFNGKISDAQWESAKELAFEGVRLSILYTPGVYLGNIKEFDRSKQPFIYTHKVTSRAEAESRYGIKDKDGKLVWENWKYVPKKKVPFLSSEDFTNVSLAGGYSLIDLQDDMVEEVHYQDRINDEYQILLNGVPMLPIGFPLSAFSPSGDFTITWQVLQPINPFFAYGRSFVARTENLADLLDEVLRLLILKTRKSVHPPYANISGKVISAKSLEPGVISMGIDPGALVAIGQEGQGATGAEFQMYEKLQEIIDKNTVSPQIQGIGGGSGTTAYEVSVLQAQAQKMIGISIFACSLLEKKVNDVIVPFVIGKYLQPKGTKYDEAIDDIRNEYRQTTRRTEIPGRGKGIRQIIPIDGKVERPSPEEVFLEEEYDGTPEPFAGLRPKTRQELNMDPIQRIYLDMDVLKNMKHYFYTEVEAKPKNTNSTAKLAFSEELSNLERLINLGSRPSIKEIEERYATIYNIRKERLFDKEPAPVEEMPMQNGTAIKPKTPPQMAVGSENIGPINTA